MRGDNPSCQRCRKLICNSRVKREWFIAGSDVKGKIWPEAQPGTGSIAHALLNGTGKSFQPRMLAATNGSQAGSKKGDVKRKHFSLRWRAGSSLTSSPYGRAEWRGSAVILPFSRPRYDSQSRPRSVRTYNKRKLRLVPREGMILRHERSKSDSTHFRYRPVGSGISCTGERAR
jgi:hypothetical protein